MANTKTRNFATLHNKIITGADGNIKSITTEGLTVTDANATTISGTDATFTGNVQVQGSLGSVQNVAGNATLTTTNFVTTVIHAGTGTITVGTEWPTGAQISLVSNGTMTIDWGTDAKGISLGNGVKIASGTFDGSKWFYSEASVN